jgi:hypothetical protein
MASLLFGAMNSFPLWYDPARDEDQREAITEHCLRAACDAINRES